jgi:predicted ATP-dependent endonuclease of OLD family
MFIIEYKYEDNLETGWNFEQLSLRKVNLLVGQSAVGKTKILNTLTNLCLCSYGQKIINNGAWHLKFKEKSLIYEWDIKISKHLVISEELNILDTDKKINLVSRSKDKFEFKGDPLPKLDYSKLSIDLLRNEEDIFNVFNAFKKVYRRNFFGEDLQQQTLTVGLDNDANFIKNALENDPSSVKDLPVSTRLYFLYQENPKLYEYICDKYMEIFPFIKSIEIQDFRQFAKAVLGPSYIPVVVFKEELTKTPIILGEMSSGMQKVLLILTDLFTMPNSSVYIIDEYENSLGENAINFLPEVITEIDKELQFIITSHHPYLINAFPVENWFIMHRRQQNVKIKNGSEFYEKWGKSKQQAFTHLINDKFYLEGIE